MLTACASPAESEESRNANIASCGVMGKLLNGDIEVNASNYADVEKTLRELAENGPDAVKTTAQYVLGGIDGKKTSEADAEAQIEKFKNFCNNYTVG